MIEIPTEPDRAPGRALATVIASVVAGIALSAAAVWALAAFHARDGGRSDLATPALQVPAEPFEAITSNELRRLGQHARLHAWTWADESHRRVRMPIDVAIDRYLAGAR